MTTATAVITLALKNAGVVGVGQTPQAEDVSDSFTVLQEMLDDWQLARTNQGNPSPLGNYTSVDEDVTFPEGYQNAILWGLTARIRPLFGLPPDEATSNLAQNGYKLVQSINRQQGENATPGAVTTVLQLLQLALRMAGRSTDVQRVAADSLDVADAFALLVQMMAQWQRKRWLVPSLQEVIIQSTGATSYQFGPPGSGFNSAFFNPALFNTGGTYAPRTDRIESAFVRQLISAGTPGDFNAPEFTSEFYAGQAAIALPVDWQLYIIGSREDYNRLPLKSLATFPSAIFYDAAFPISNLYVWPVAPAGRFEFHLFVKATLQQFAKVTDALLVPPEYVEAMLYNLAARICLTFGTDVRQGVAQMAKASLNTIRLANAQIPELRMPTGLLGPSWGQRGYAGFLSGGAI